MEKQCFQWKSPYYNNDPHVFGMIGKVLKGSFQWCLNYFFIINYAKVIVFQRFRKFSKSCLAAINRDLTIKQGIKV